LASYARAPTPGGYLIHTLSTRTLSALAYDPGEEYDPGQPPCLSLLDDLGMAALAGPVIGEDGRDEQARRRRRERRELSAVPARFSAQGLLAAPWETDGELLV
jgi:hypothetical protein